MLLSYLKGVVKEWSHFDIRYLLVGFWLHVSNEHLLTSYYFPTQKKQGVRREAAGESENENAPLLAGSSNIPKKLVLGYEYLTPFEKLYFILQIIVSFPFMLAAVLLEVFKHIPLLKHIFKYIIPAPQVLLVILSRIAIDFTNKYHPLSWLIKKCSTVLFEGRWWFLLITSAVVPAPHWLPLLGVTDVLSYLGLPGLSGEIIYYTAMISIWLSIGLLCVYSREIRAALARGPDAPRMLKAYPVDAKVNFTQQAPHHSVALVDGHHNEHSHGNKHPNQRMQGALSYNSDADGTGERREAKYSSGPDAAASVSKPSFRLLHIEGISSPCYEMVGDSKDASDLHRIPHNNGELVLRRHKEIYTREKSEFRNRELVLVPGDKEGVTIQHPSWSGRSKVTVRFDSEREQYHLKFSNDSKEGIWVATTKDVYLQLHSEGFRNVDSVADCPYVTLSDNGFYYVEHSADQAGEPFGFETLNEAAQHISRFGENTRRLKLLAPNIYSAEGALDFPNALVRKRITAYPDPTPFLKVKAAINEAIQEDMRWTTWLEKVMQEIGLAESNIHKLDMEGLELAFKLLLDEVMPNAVIEIEKHRGMDSTCESIRSDIELCIEAGQFVEAIQLMRQCPKQVESFMSDELLPVLKICYGLMNQIQEFSPKPNKGLSPRSHEQDFAAGPAIIAGCIKQVKILIEGAKVRSLHEAKAEEPDALDDAVTENNPTPLQYFTESLFYTKQSFWVVLNELTKLWTLVFGKAGNAEKRFDGVRQLIEEGKFEAALSEITKFVYDIDRIIKQRRQFILQTKMIIDALPFFIKRVLVKHAPLLVEALEEIRLVEEGALPSQGLVEKIGQELLKLWSTLDLVEIKNREDRHKEKWRISLNTILQDKIQQGALLDSSPKDRQEVEVKASLEDISNVDFGQLIQGLLEREAYASAQFLLKLTPLRDHFGHSLEEVLVELGANHNDEETYQHISHVYHEHQCEQVERLISEILNAIGQRVSFRELEDQFERKMRRINDYHTALPEELKNRYLSAVAAMSSYLNSLRNEGAVAMDEPSKEASLIKEINEFLSPLAVADAKEPDNAGEVVTGLVQAKKLIAQYRELLEKKAQAGSDLPDNQELYQSVGSLLEYLSEKYSEACVDSNKNLLRVVVAPLEVLEHLYKKNLLQAAVVQSRILLELGDMFFVLDQMEEDKNIDFDLPENAHSQLHGLLLQKLESILGTAYKWPLSFLADDSLYGCINLLMILASENPNSENTVRLMTWICTKNFSSLQAVEAFMRLGNMKAAVDLLQCYSAKASCQEFNRVCEALMDEIEGFLGSVDDSKSDGIAEKLPDIEILVAKYQAFRQIRQNFSHQEPIVQKFYQYLQNAYKELYDACLTSLMREKNLIKILDDFIKLQQIVMAITRLGQVDIAVPSPSGLDSLLFDMGKAFEHHQNEFEFLVSTRRYGCLKKLLEADKNGHQNSLTKLIREGNTQVLDAIDAFVCSENNDVANDILESVHSPTDQISVHKLLFDIEGFSRLGTAGEGRGVTLDPSWIKDVAQDIAEAKKLAIRCQALRRALNDPPEIFFDYLHKKHRETLDYTIALCNDRNNNLSPVTPMQILDGLIVLDEIALIFQRMRRKEGAALALPAILSDAALAHGLQSDIHPKYANCIEALVSAKRYGCMKLLREWHLNIMGDQENAERKIATLQGLVQSRDSRTLDALEAFARSENKGAVENVLHFVAKADKNMPPVRNILSRMLLSPLPARSRAGSLCGLSAVPQIAVKQSPNARRSSCA